MGFFSDSSSEAQPVHILGKPLVCPVCQNNYFRLKKVQLNTRLFSFLNVDWANKNATCFICEKCSFIFWFEQNPLT